MRYKEGQNIIVTFSDENVFRCKIISINDQSIEIKLEEKHVNITIRTTELPDEIFGEKFSSEWKLWHASDVLRNRVLLEFGGIYLDRDVYVVKSLDKFRRYEMAVGLE